MSRVCTICGKMPTKGRLVSHAQNKTNRRFLPNLRMVRVLLGNNLRRMKVCSRCVRTAKRSSREVAAAIVSTPVQS